MPWRNEEEELLNPNVNIKNIFDEHKEIVKAESKQFNKLGDAEMFEIVNRNKKCRVNRRRRRCARDRS